MKECTCVRSTYSPLLVSAGSATKRLFCPRRQGFVRGALCQNRGLNAARMLQVQRSVRAPLSMCTVLYVIIWAVKMAPPGTHVKTRQVRKDHDRPYQHHVKTTACLGPLLPPSGTVALYRKVTLRAAHAVAQLHHSPFAVDCSWALLLGARLSAVSRHSVAHLFRVCSSPGAPIMTGPSTLHRRHWRRCSAAVAEQSACDTAAVTQNNVGDT